ncbi:MAG: helix-turn-helix domain-containing protein [bacterium]|nr:helix-turn-helix domain-containing protein [bacterium]
MAYFVQLALPSAFLLLVFAAGEFAVRPIRKRNTLLAAVFTIFALILIRADSLFGGWLPAASALFEWPLPLNFWIGPLTYAYMREALGLGPVPGFAGCKSLASGASRASASRRSLLMHCAPGLLVFFVLIPNLLQPPEITGARIAGLIQYLQGAGPAPRDPYALLLPLGILHAAAYLGLIMRDMLLLLKLKHLRDHGTVRAFLLVVGIAFACSCLAVIGVVSGRPQWMGLSIGLLATIPVLLYILQRRHPHFFHDLENLLREERERARYRRSQLDGVNQDRLERRLAELMDRERVFAREDLSLTALAELLQITPHQLSEYFNHVRNINFAGFINAYRVNAARELLLADPKRTVLSIAYDVGFNSKSAFNEAFAKHAGVSPTRWRKTGADNPG